jgi:glycosyltransferase involved in cell wall biosynthesis
MRIAVLFDLASPEMGGSYSFNKMIFDNLVKNQSKHKHQFLTAYKDGNMGVRPDIALPGKIRYRVGFVRSLLSQIEFGGFLKNGVDLEACRSASIRSTLKKHDIDLVWAVQPLGFKLDIPYLTTSWDIAHRITPYFPEVSSKRGQMLKRERICASVFSGAFRIIVGTERGKQEITTAYGVNPERITVNPLPVDAYHLLPSTNRNSTQIIYPANFWPHKNHLLLIKALSKLNNRSDLKVNLVLTGSDKGTLSAVKSLVADLELQDFVQFFGFVSESELVNLYLSSSLLVFPSLIGPDNLPPLEALSFGCKVAVSDIPGAREQFGKFATYFNPQCAEDLADKIEQGLCNDASALNSTELKSFLENRSTDRYVEIVLEEIEKLNHIIDVI